MSLTRERTLLDQNSLKHENSYSELGGPVLTPKFGKLSLEKKRSPDDVESKKNLLIKVYLRAGRGIFFKIFGDTWHPGVSHQPGNIIWYILRCITYDLLGSWWFWDMGGHQLRTMELESRQDTCWFHALGIRQAVQWIGFVQARLRRSPTYSSIEKGTGL